jgi:hypothetical protein
MSSLFNWHEALPNIGDFFNKVGFPMGVWLVTVFILYKLFYTIGYKALSKLWNKVEPIMDAHFELVTSMKDNLSKQTEIMSATNVLIETKLDKHTIILEDHSKALDRMLKMSEKRNELLEQNGSTKKLKPSPSNNGSVGNIHGTK